MKVKYIGESFGVESLTNGKIYECIGIEKPFLRIIDNSEEDYLYDTLSPRDLNSNASGKWEIIEDDEKGSLKDAIDNYKPVDFGKFVMYDE